MEKVKREDVAGILAEKVMGWRAEEDRMTGVYHYIKSEWEPMMSVKVWNPLDDEMCCALVRDKLAETCYVNISSARWWTTGDEPVFADGWDCVIEPNDLAIHDPFVGVGEHTPAGYRESICRAALATLGMEVE